MGPAAVGPCRGGRRKAKGGCLSETRQGPDISGPASREEYPPGRAAPDGAARWWSARRRMAEEPWSSRRNSDDRATDRDRKASAPGVPSAAAPWPPARLASACQAVPHDRRARGGPGCGRASPRRAAAGGSGTPPAAPGSPPRTPRPRQRSGLAAIDEARGIAAGERGGGIAEQAQPQPQDGQSHAAAAAILPPLHPGRLPAAPQHGLVFDLGRGDTGRRGDREALDPALAARDTGPLPQHAGHIAHALDMGQHFAGPVGPGGGAGQRRRSDGSRRRGRGAGAELHHLQAGGGFAGLRRLIDGHQDLRRAARDPHQRGILHPRQPAIVAEAADIDRFRPAGGVRGQRDAHPGQAGGGFGHRRAGGMEDAEQPRLQRHQMAADLELDHPAGARLRNGCRGGCRGWRGQCRGAGFWHNVSRSAFSLRCRSIESGPDARPVSVRIPDPIELLCRFIHGGSTGRGQAMHC